MNPQLSDPSIRLPPILEDCKGGLENTKRTFGLPLLPHFQQSCEQMDLTPSGRVALNEEINFFFLLLSIKKKIEINFFSVFEIGGKAFVNIRDKNPPCIESISNLTVPFTRSSFTYFIFAQGEKKERFFHVPKREEKIIVLRT
jgi:hypothetical protein